MQATQLTGLAAIDQSHGAVVQRTTFKGSCISRNLWQAFKSNDWYAYKNPRGFIQFNFSLFLFQDLGFAGKANIQYLSSVEKIVVSQYK